MKNKILKKVSNFSFFDWLSLILPPILVIIYYLIFDEFIYDNVLVPTDTSGIEGTANWDLLHVGSKYTSEMLLFSYTTEIFATITFQLRIKWTAEGKIQSAAIIGAISWFSAVMGVIIMTSAGIGGMLLLSPPILLATWQGIYVNHVFKEKRENGK